MRCYAFLVVFAGLASFFTGISRADQVAVSIEELNIALEFAQQNPDAAQQQILHRMLKRLKSLDLRLDSGASLYQDTIKNKNIIDGCNRTIIQHLATDVSLAPQTAITLDVQPYRDPSNITLDVYANLAATGEVRQIKGVKLIGCQAVAIEQFSIQARGHLNLRLELNVQFNPKWIDKNTLRIHPKVVVSGQLLDSAMELEVDRSRFRNTIAQALQPEFDKLISPDRVKEEIQTLQQNIDRQLAEWIRGYNPDASSEAGVDIVLSPTDSHRMLALYKLLSLDKRLPLSIDYINERRVELLAALVMHDRALIKKITHAAVACEVVQAVQIPLPRAPLYAKVNGNCQATRNLPSNGTVYVDSACALPVKFSNTNPIEHCRDNLEGNRVGNSQLKTEALGRWTFSPGSMLEGSVLSIAGKKQPLMQRIRYRAVTTDGGQCQLEMRVYSNGPYSKAQKPLIALHGGSWKHRRLNVLGIETIATHFVDAGFVVFAPFYRQLGDVGGISACNNASLPDIKEDLQFALKWVDNNKASYGAYGKPVVFGQSSGGHLAASLAITNPKKVERAVLFYGPVDFRDFGEQIKNGAYAKANGLHIFENVTGVKIEEMDLDSELMIRNSFPKIVADSPAEYPPFFLLHGAQDKLLPFRQSVLLCNALSGRPVSASVAESTSSMRKIIACDDRGSQLHLLAQAKHAIELCLSGILCNAGPPLAAKHAADSFQAMIDWAAADTVEDLVPTGDIELPGIGVMDIRVLFVFLVLVRFRRKKYVSL